MTESPTNETERNGNGEDMQEQAVTERDAPTVPRPAERGPDVDRRIREAVVNMLEDVQNPYEVVIVASQEARRINERKLKARSVINQALEHVEELVPEVPFVPRPVEDEEPEVKATNEAMEKLACGLVDYVVEGEVRTAPSYYGEIDFPTDPAELDALNAEKEGDLE
jgi:hypothetical protein